MGTTGYTLKDLGNLVGDFDILAEFEKLLPSFVSNEQGRKGY